MFAQGRRSSDRYFTLLVRENDRGAGARLGLAIAKKGVRRAVDRNRIKRVAREFFRQHRREVPGLDIVLMSRPPAASADNETLRRSLEGHWARLRKWCEESSSL